MHPQLMKLIEDEEDNKGKSTLKCLLMAFVTLHTVPN